MSHNDFHEFLQIFEYLTSLNCWSTFKFRKDHSRTITAYIIIIIITTTIIIIFITLFYSQSLS